MRDAFCVLVETHQEYAKSIAKCFQKAKHKFIIYWLRTACFTNCVLRRAKWSNRNTSAFKLTLKLTQPRPGVVADQNGHESVPVEARSSTRTSGVKRPCAGRNAAPEVLEDRRRCARWPWQCRWGQSTPSTPRMMVGHCSALCNCNLHVQVTAVEFSRNHLYRNSSHTHFHMSLIYTSR
jgi:hypothetical protein